VVGFQVQYSLSKLDGRGPAIKLGSDTIEPSGHVRVLGVIMSSDLSLEKHVSVISATCFFHLRQIRCVRQSLDVGSAKTLVQAFVASRVDYCNAVLAESPRVMTDKLQRVMNSTARVVTNTRKYDSGLSRLMHDELHWLDVADRVRFKLAVLMYRCLSSWNCSAVLGGQLYTRSRSHWPSTSAFCHSAEVCRTALSTEQFRSSALFCDGPVDLEFAARHSS